MVFEVVAMTGKVFAKTKMGKPCGKLRENFKLKMKN